MDHPCNGAGWPKPELGKMKYLIRGPTAKGRVGFGSRSFSALPLGQGPQDVPPRVSSASLVAVLRKRQRKKDSNPTRSQALQLYPRLWPETSQAAGKHRALTPEKVLAKL